MGDLLTPADAAQIAKCTESRIRQLLRQGVIKGFQWNGRWMVRRSSLHKYAKSAPYRTKKRVDSVSTRKPPRSRPC